MRKKESGSSLYQWCRDGLEEQDEAIGAIESKENLRESKEIKEGVRRFETAS